MVLMTRTKSRQISSSPKVLLAFPRRPAKIRNLALRKSNLIKPTKNFEAMKTNFINSIFTSITILLIAGCASMTQAPSTPPSATVKIQEWSAAYYAQAEAGKGTLYYHGGRHHFTISGGGVGGSGAQKVSATGKVYNLNNLSSFSGTYHGIARGLTLIEGKMHAKLTNGNGVVMYLAGETEGLASSLGAQAFGVNLTD
jgi:hypothetical protein